MKSIVFGLIWLTSLCAAAGAGLPPWQFGMTKAEVASFREFGPYKTFSNGDIETFNGRFRERKQNVQFFFERGRLPAVHQNVRTHANTRRPLGTVQGARRSH